MFQSAGTFRMLTFNVQFLPGDDIKSNLLDAPQGLVTFRSNFYAY